MRTVDMCSVRPGETRPAWDPTPEGTRVYGGHWAPCRHGTRWTDKVVIFETKIESLGASWAVHMVANGVIFCLDIRRRVLEAYIGLSKYSGIFPTCNLGCWDLPVDVDATNWMRIVTVAQGESVTVSIHGHEIATISDVQVQPLLGGSGPNTGSVAFGGPVGWVATFRHLRVTDGERKLLYCISLLQKEAERVYSDFQVGTNKLPCLIDGAKRDRACFSADAHVTGRSIAYSTGDLEAWKGSLQLLMSHQTQQGFIGNLCPIQAPEHDTEHEPPTYAFYSLAYAMFVIVSVKDYWYHSGDKEFVQDYYSKMQHQLRFTEGLLNQDGVVEAPPPLSSK